MEDLIKLNNDSVFSVDARDLHFFLFGEKTHYAAWSEKHIKKSIFLTKDIDFQLIPIRYLEVRRGRTPYPDYKLTIDAAMQLSLQSQTKKGKEARDWFIEVGKQAKVLNEVVKENRNTELIDKMITVLEGFIDRLHPKEIAAPVQPKQLAAPQEPLSDTQKAISFEMAAQLLKAYRKDKKKPELMGRNCLSKYMKSIGWLMKNRMPFQKFSHLFTVKEVTSGNIKGIPMTLLNPPTLNLLKEIMKKDGYKFAENSNQLEII
jgi:phage anti-repressor protein